MNFGRRPAVDTSTQTARPRIARLIRSLAPLIILAWTALILVLNLAVPSLEEVGRERGLTASSQDAPAMQAMTRMGKVFQESDSDSFATVVLEGQEPLDDDFRAYYDGLIRALKNDPQHVQHVQDLWGDRLTAGGAQSPDGKAVYVPVSYTHLTLPTILRV